MNSSRTFRIALITTCLSLLGSSGLRAQMPEAELTALREQAEAGDPIAQHNLGLKYADSKDKYFNLAESYAWLKVASTRGASGNALAVVEGQLSSGQRSEAESRIASITQALAAKGDTGPAPGFAESPVAPAAESAAEYKKLSEELSGAWKENDQLKAELGRLRAAAANFEGERNGLLLKVKNAEAALASAQATAGAPKASEKDTKSADEIMSLKAQLEDAQLKLEAALGSFSKQQHETERVQKALVAVEAERAAAAERVSTLEKQASQAASAPAPAADPSLSIRLQAAEGALRQAQSERDQLRSELESARSASAGAVTAAAAPATSTDSSAPVDEDTRKALADVQMKLEVSLRSFAVQRAELDKAQQRIAALEADKAGLESKLSDAGIKITDTTALADAGAKAAAELNRLQEQLRQTQNQLAAVINENIQMRDRLSLPPRPTSGAILATPMRPGTFSAAPTPTPTPAVRTHQIEPGDTLSRIARRYLGNAERWAEILEINPGLDPSKLYIGETIKLPAQ